MAHNSDKIPFDPKNIGYIVNWWDSQSRENEGETLVENLWSIARGRDDIVWRLKDKSQSWLEMSQPSIRQFEDLQSILGGRLQVYYQRFDPLPANRTLNVREKKTLYQTLRHEISGYDPRVQAEVLLPMFYK
jgi:hypothetical protein